MVFTSWRGVVGCVKPTHRPGSLEEFIRLLPEGIGVVPVYLNFQRGTEDEFRAALNAVHEKVAELAKEGVDLIHPEGAPPFMVHGYKGEAQIVKDWETEFKTPIVTAAQTQVAALRALGIKKFVGVTYFTGSINEMFTRYFEEAGFEVFAMEGMEVAFADVGRVASTEIYAHTHRAFLKKSRRGRHLHARYRLALSRYYSSARGRPAGTRRSSRTGPSMGGTETSSCAPTDERLRQVVGRDALISSSSGRRLA
jgi:maleate cis-trans isomerase